MKPKKFKKTLVGNNIKSAPKIDEIEVSIFGPGYGESILLHLGQNNWIIVDSCIDFNSKKPVPLTYLNQIGINPTTAVKQVISTHWHDDHIRGLGNIFKECKSAEFVCSAALRSEEFLTLVNAYGTRSMISSSGIQELYEIIKILEKRNNNQNSQRKYISPKFASADRPLWKNPGLDHPCTIYALSPSDASMLLSYKEITALIPKTSKKRILTQSPNNISVVLWINVGDISILLGSDLEKTKDPKTGWSAILNSKTRPQRKASLFKIPHHGSKTSDHHLIWTKLLEINPISVLTPFVRGRTSLPTKQDVDRICERTNSSYSTARFNQKKVKKKRNKVVEKQIRELGIKIKEVYHSTGHVRLRTKNNVKKDGWTVELFGGALPLHQLYKET